MIDNNHHIFKKFIDKCNSELEELKQKFDYVKATELDYKYTLLYCFSLIESSLRYTLIEAILDNRNSLEEYCLFLIKNNDSKVNKKNLMKIISNCSDEKILKELFITNIKISFDYVTSVKNMFKKNMIIFDFTPEYVKSFNILKQIRNILVHSNGVYSKEGSIELNISVFSKEDIEDAFKLVNLTLINIKQNTNLYK